MSLPADRGLRDELFLLLVPIAILAPVSSQTGFSEHMRYVLPLLPFVFIWISQVAPLVAGGRLPSRSLGMLPPSSCQVEPVGGSRSDAATPSGSRFNELVPHPATGQEHPVSRVHPLYFIRYAFFFLVAWSVGSSLAVYPHSLSYFNELVGGPEGGSAHLLSSNVDWGQDLLYLKEWLDEHPDEGPLFLAYFGYFDPVDVGFEFSAPPMPAPGDKRSAELPQGLYAISVNFLRGYPLSAADGQGGQTSFGRDAFNTFRDVTPVGRAGFSIYIFRVTGRSGRRVGGHLRHTGNHRQGNRVAYITPNYDTSHDAG